MKFDKEYSTQYWKEVKFLEDIRRKIGRLQKS